MNQLDPLYAGLLKVGFIVLRQAMESKDAKWIDAEMEMLHNVPSLIGERNAARHLYYWDWERPHYQQTIEGLDQTLAVSRMRTYYEPLWQEMRSVFNNPELFPIQGNRAASGA